jgi:hypothetical protein
MDDYEQGQVDLIKDISLKVLDITENSSENNIVLDVIHLLKNLKPIIKK